jgi:phosphotransferase system enzyme I (PtsI)
MRTEFLVLGRASMPDEEEQYLAYRKVVEAFAGQPVIIRTFDIGGDKLPEGGYPQEPNPFLGWRAIRMCLDQPNLFKTQLRALLRAGVHGRIKILLPLIISLDEIRETAALIREASAELAAARVPHRVSVPLGVMIETPAAAILADDIANEVDFFSIGTNDLVQYTLAVDRGNVELAARFTPMHPSVLRLIHSVVNVADKRGIEVGVCGEMASHPLSAFLLIGLGVRELSVAPRAVPVIKRLVRSMSVVQAREAAVEAMSAGTAGAAEALIRERLDNLLTSVGIGS